MRRSDPRLAYGDAAQFAGGDANIARRFEAKNPAVKVDLEPNIANAVV